MIDAINAALGNTPRHSDARDAARWRRAASHPDAAASYIAAEAIADEFLAIRSRFVERCAEYEAATGTESFADTLDRMWEVPQ